MQRFNLLYPKTEILPIRMFPLTKSHQIPTRSGADLPFHGLLMSLGPNACCCCHAHAWSSAGDGYRADSLLWHLNRGEAWGFV